MSTRLHTLNFAINEEAYKAKAIIEDQEVIVTQDRAWPDRNYCSVLRVDHFHSVEEIERHLERNFHSYRSGDRVWEPIEEDE